jgi:hypothetical protein
MRSAVGPMVAVLLTVVSACGSEPMSNAGSNASTSEPSVAAPSGAGSSAPATSSAGSSAAKPGMTSSGAAAAGRSGASAPAGSAGTPAAAAAAGSSASAGSGGTPAAVSGGAGTAGSDAANGGTAGAAGGAGSTAPASTGPTLPPTDNPGGPGPFDSRYVATAPGLNSHGLFVPSEQGTNGKNPVVVWTCGNGGTISFYMGFLEHLASHGFFVVADKGSSSDRLAEVQSQNDAIAWVLEQNMSGDYAGKLDVDHIAVMGHSLGSLASFATAAMNEHVATSVHYSGGLTGNPVGFDESWLGMMTKPAAFLCGGNDGMAGPSCEMDFNTAPAMLPVFYGVLRGADHLGPFALAPRGGEYGRAGVAWLRWKLANDETYKPWFAGSGCMLCSGDWAGMQKNLD